ncbi:MAG TPA: allantoinase AllB [Chthoniobacterales bacterium]
MSDFDLLVRGEPDIGIAAGKIVALGKNLGGSAREEIDATNLSIFPGVIDSHVHFNEPGRSEWEGFASGSRAAAAGGTTTIFDMPLNAHPPTIDGPSFDAKRAAAEQNSMVDFGLWGGLVPGNLDQLKTLRDRGVVGLKAFMCNSGIDDFPSVDHASLSEGMCIAADLGLLVAVHAESEKMTSDLTKACLAAGQATVADYLASRPLEAELEAIQSAIQLAHKTGCRLHIVHVSGGSGVQLVAQARAKGVDVTCETCPHYLMLCDIDMQDIGAAAKCAPPLRSIAEGRDLWKRLSDVTTIGSDHSPAPPEMKQSSNFFEIWGGISSCQHLLPLMINSAQDPGQEMTPEQIARWTSENVAQRFRISDKGGLALGKDADLTIVDSQNGDVITADTLFYRHRQSVYLGRKMRCRVERTILRGQTIFDHGKILPGPGARLVRPDPL